MNWIEINARFDRAPEDWSPVIDLLDGLGCSNTLLQDRPPSITACIAETPGAVARVQQITAALEEAGAASVLTKTIAEENWAEAWRQYFKPRRIGRRFVIRPTWESFEASPEDCVIVLDPGQAFGTGDHPTSRLCLELLEDAPIEGARVADVGCGSGILAIAAALLGARKVAGVDIEPLAVEIARMNAELNGVSIDFTAGDSVSALAVYADSSEEGDWDVVVSNIVSATLIAMSLEIAGALRSGGRWIVSGILEANWPDVQRAAQDVGFAVEQRREEDGWVAATFQR